MRRVNRIASGLLGVVLIAAGLLVALETAVVAAGRRPLWLPLDRWYQTLGVATLSHRAVLVAAVVIGLVGIAILVAELRRWAPDRLQTAGESAESWWVSRRSMERRTASAAAAVPGVARARAQVRGRPSRWRLRLRADGQPEQRDAVRDAVRGELDRLDVPAGTSIVVALRKPNGRVA